MNPKEDLQEEIARTEKRIEELLIETEHAKSHLSALLNALRSVPANEVHSSLRSVTPAQQASMPTNAQKVALFRSLFRGREDVFARRWENEKSGKSGYSPVCHNDWVSGICAKNTRSGERQKATCSECVHRSFVPLTDEEVVRHLKGEHVIGVYPLLADERCWFLAVDFDKHSWQEDVAAFAETCQSHDLSVAIERSRSGNGAHAWFFFREPVSAILARKLGCYLITETMARRHQLSMDSYDRLFPNQDRLTKGGFGNLIALPLQYYPRQSANSVFVDPTFAPLPDQWSFLGTLRRLEPGAVRELVDNAECSNLIVGMREPEPSDESDLLPWDQSEHAQTVPPALKASLPDSVNAVLAQRLFLETKGLPSPLLNQIKRLAAFANPEFYKRQSMRLSTALTPRIISCSEDLPGNIALPRGCLPVLERLLGVWSVALRCEDKREGGSPLDVGFHGQLSALQEKAVRALLDHDTGVLVAPPGAGKTVVGAFLIAARKRSTLIIVHRKPLLTQWIEQMSHFLGIEKKDVGQIGGGKNTRNGKLDVAMLQSLFRLGQISDLVEGYGQVIVDECHHVPSFSLERVLSTMKCRYVAGLTATPQRRDGHPPIIFMQIGPVRHSADEPGIKGRQEFTRTLVIREPPIDLASISPAAGIQDIYAALVSSQERNDAIFDDVIRALEERRSPLVLTERKDHLDHFVERFRSFAKNLIVLHGTMTVKERRQALERLTTIPETEERLILATGRYIGEGFDDARLDTLFLALPISWKGTLVQYSGRLLRPYQNKNEVRIYDTSTVPCLCLRRCSQEE